MIHAARRCRSAKGATLVESILAVSVLAVAVPLVLGVLAEAGNKGSSAKAETRSAWIVPACMEEIQASRDGRPQYLPASKPGQPFPPAGDVWALGFAADGSPLGRVGRSLYQSGLKELAGGPVRYIAVMKAVAEPQVPGAAKMFGVRISVEYPASVPAERRDKINFHTRIP